MEAKTEARADLVAGEWIQPINHWQGAGENSIHNDAVARGIGMRGGTIPGTVHLGHFGAMMDRLFVDRWLKTGSVGMYYTFATTDREDVRAIVRAPQPPCADENAQFDAWVENAEGKVVCKGSVAVGRPDAVSYVRGLELKSSPDSERRITKDCHVGDELRTMGNYMFPGADAPRADGMPWRQIGKDGGLRDPGAMYGAMMMNFRRGQIAQPSVGFFGATEITLRDGPIMADTPYTKTGRIVCVGVTDRTEFAWYDCELRDTKGALIAEMRHLTRWMKASSPLWK